MPSGVEPASRSAEASTPGDLAAVRRHVFDASELARLDGERAGGLAVAVNEIVTNAIRHGVPPATITIRLTSSALLVAVHDHGTRFRAPEVYAQHRRAERPGLERTSGRGLWLAAQLCDRLDLDTGADGTTVTLVMNL